ncbi:MAG: DUF3102 domain-containing protein [Acidobacteriia bacterium]|nr:DUF3102 domain-containing protein [Terriglobia bacterium]
MKNNVVRLERRKLTPEQWAEQIRGCLSQTVGAVIESGRKLAEAKDILEHGEWLGMFRQKLLPINERHAQMLVKIAAHPVLSNPNHWYVFPNSWRTLYELTRVPNCILEEEIKAGRVHPEMTRGDALRLAVVVTKHRQLLAVAEGNAATAAKKFNALQELEGMREYVYTALGRWPRNLWPEFTHELDNIVSEIRSNAFALHVPGVFESLKRK